MNCPPGSAAACNSSVLVTAPLWTLEIDPVPAAPATVRSRVGPARAAERSQYCAAGIGIGGGKHDRALAVDVERPGAGVGTGAAGAGLVGDHVIDGQCLAGRGTESDWAGSLDKDAGAETLPVAAGEAPESGAALAARAAGGQISR